MIATTVRLSKEFKKQTLRTIFSLVIFAAVYILILVAAVGLTIACVYGGLMMVVLAPRLVTIGLGIGLASLGFFILYFLFKFIFTSNKVDRSHLQRITREEQPDLFLLLDDIVSKVGTTFPKNVYLSSEVNASVFYDSSFWSMFLPIRKNLQIGLGLVNSVTHDELKAILSHEFGHFSQRTMKVGSYVYNVNPNHL